MKKSKTFCFKLQNTYRNRKRIKKAWPPSCHQIDIVTKTVKDNINIFTPILVQEFNKLLKFGKFPSDMKLVDVIPVLKMRIEPTKKTTDYKHIIHTLSKVFQRCLYNQLSVHFARNNLWCITKRSCKGFWVSFTGTVGCKTYSIWIKISSARLIYDYLTNRK